jgi:YbbR domain-containing protein
VTARDFLRRHLVHNLGLKLTALLLALGMWLAVASSPSAEMALNIPIIFRNMPQNLEISSETIPSVQVRIRGPERIVRRLEPAALHAEIDLMDIKAGEHTFDLTKAISVPDKLEVSEVVPSEFPIAFDARAVRRIPVHPRVVGRFATGYSIRQIQSDPDLVEIVGPKKDIDRVESAITDPIDVSGVLDRLSVVRLAYVPDPLIQVRDPNAVRITITIKKETLSSPAQPE